METERFWLWAGPQGTLQPHGELLPRGRKARPPCPQCQGV